MIALHNDFDGVTQWSKADHSYLRAFNNAHFEESLVELAVSSQGRYDAGLTGF